MILELQRDLLEYLESLRKEIRALRRDCILAGHSTYELDARMAVIAIEGQTDERTTRPMKAVNHRSTYGNTFWIRDSSTIGPRTVTASIAGCFTRCAPTKN